MVWFTFYHFKNRTDIREKILTNSKKKNFLRKKKSQTKFLLCFLMAFQKPIITLSSFWGSEWIVLYLLTFVYLNGIGERKSYVGYQDYRMQNDTLAAGYNVLKIQYIHFA